MSVDFAFGRTGLRLDLPAGPDYQILEPKWAQSLANPENGIAAALDAPIGSASLSALARAKSSAAISICDITRPAPNRLTLPPVLERLHAAGIPREKTTLLIATGLHRPATSAELDEILGPEIARSYPVVNHDARARDQHRDLGLTSTGTPVLIDERWVSAELHITLGFIEPHLMAGFSGARKLIAPGLAYQDTIKTIHSPRFMRDPRAVEGSIQDNPLHRELWEISAMAGHDFLVDVVLGRGRKVCAVFAGAPREAHDAGIDFVRRHMAQRLDAPVDAVITTAAGYPLDLTFYQAIKGVTAAQHIVKPGGIILLMAACQEGAGAAEFSRMLRQAPPPDQFLASLDHRPVVVDQWQMEKLALVAREKQVWWYTPGLPREYHARLWGRPFTSAGEALAALPRQGRIAVIPEGPYVLATL